MKSFSLLLLTLLLAAQLCFAEKVGETVVEGKVYILHKVTSGETLYSLSRTYQIHVDEILDANPNMSTRLSVGQIVKVPSQIKEKPASTTIETKQVTNTKEKYHTIESGETLYSIAKLYNISVEELKAMNAGLEVNLAVGDRVIVGEKPKDAPQFHIVEKGETLFSISRKFEVSVDEIKAWNNLPSNALSLGQKLILHSNADIEPTATSVTIAPSREVANGKITEKGLAELIESEDISRKHLCLHKSAEKGTILQVKNEENGAVVFVRVVGSLPSTQANENTLIRLSQTAFEKLGAERSRFPVEVMYIP